MELRLAPSGIKLPVNSSPMLIPREFFFKDIFMVRAFKIPRVYTQFWGVELRIGNTNKSGSPREQFTENRLIGFSGPHAYTSYHQFDAIPKAEGRFLTLQTLALEYLAVAEIFVYKEN